MKTCSKCKQQFPATTEYFQPRKDSKDGLRGQCVDCVSKRKHNYYLRNQEHTKEKSRKYHYENRDKILKYQKEKYEKNKDKWRGYHLKRYSKRRDEILQYQKVYLENNRDQIRRYKKKYSEENAEKLKEQRRKFYLANKDKFDVRNQKRQASKRELPNSLTVEQWEQCRKHFDYKCCYCGKKKKLAQEHFIPLSEGGEYTINNILPACKSCNSSKRNKDFFEWYPQWEHYSKEREKEILKYLNYKQNKTQQLALI